MNDKLHGIDHCQKVPHLGVGYMHAEGDNSPYQVDGISYCGRCHFALSTPVPMDQLESARTAGHAEEAGPGFDLDAFVLAVIDKYIKFAPGAYQPIHAGCLKEALRDALYGDRFICIDGPSLHRSLYGLRGCEVRE